MDDSILRKTDDVVCFPGARKVHVTEHIGAGMIYISTCRTVWKTLLNLFINVFV